MNNKVTFGKSVSEEQAEFEDRDIWTDQLEGVPVGQQVDNAEQILAEAAADEDGVEVLRPTREQERQGQRDYDWERSADLDHPFGMTLAAEEREMERQREKALAAHEAEMDVERERSCRVQSVIEVEQDREDFRARADVAADRDPETDPRETMDAETLGAVNKFARKVAKQFEDAPSYAALSKEIAERVDSGQSPGGAAMAVKDRLVNSEWAVIPIEEIDESMSRKFSSLQGEGYGDFEVSIQGEVTTLYDPSRPSQQQVGWVEDETGRAKVTICARSGCTTALRGGDTVRLRGLKVDWYKGQPSLAVTSTSEVEVLEEGDGEMAIHGHLTDASFDNPATGGDISEEEAKRARSELANGRYRRPSTVEESPLSEFQDVVREQDAPEWWLEQERVTPVDDGTVTEGLGE